MSTKLEIPAGLIGDVRESLFLLLGGAAEAIVHSLEQPGREHHPEWFRDDRRELEDALELLDLAGWDASRASPAIDVELGRHGASLKQAIDGYVPFLEDQEAEADTDDRRRAAAGEQPRRRQIVERLVAFRALSRVLEERLGSMPRAPWSPP
jgi:hypothetical protein